MKPHIPYGWLELTRGSRVEDGDCFWCWGKWAKAFMLIGHTTWSEDAVVIRRNPSTEFTNPNEVRQ